jgi:cell division protein FtsI/penicillin-binding protein 2
MLPLTYRVSPGSTFKPFTVGEALTGPNACRLEDTVDCGHPAGTHGRLRVAGRFVKNYKERRHGNATVEEALYRSHNVGIARLAERLGPDRMVGLLGRLGFRRQDGGFCLEISERWRRLGRLPGATSLPSQWRPRISHISWSFGQEMQLTLLDLCHLYTALATDGRLRPPRLVKRVEAEDGSDRTGEVGVSGAPPGRRLFSPEIAGSLRAVLAKVVECEEGTLNRVFRRSPELFGGWRMGGKTGTATEENPAVKAALAQPRWRGHSDNALSLVVLGPIGDGPARYIVALSAPHPRARDLRYISSGQVLGPYGVQIMRFLLDRDRHRSDRRDRLMARGGPGES